VPEPLAPPSAPSHDFGPPVDDAYADVVGRRSVDHMLSNAHQQLAVLSNQADFKANILITVSTIALSIVVTRLDDAELRWSLVTLSAFLLIALLCAVVAVVPKFSTLRGRRPPPPVGFDPLFFGHFARLPQDRYVDYMAGILREDASVYRTLVANLHAQGTYLIRSKYRFLRAGYAAFITGVVAGTIQLIVTTAT
jgi:hypothetical protein